MKDELVKIYDENGVYLNEMVCKKIAKHNNLFHKAIHLWIMVGDKILIQQRNENKKIFPGKWDISVAGHIVGNDTSVDTVVKEVKEELGLEIKKMDFEFLYTLRRTGETKGNMFFDTYVLKLSDNFDMTSITLEESEVQDVKLVELGYFENLIDEFAPREMECSMFLVTIGQ